MAKKGYLTPAQARAERARLADAEAALLKAQEELKALRPEVPVVLVTGWGVEVPSDQLRQSGVDRVMSKPFRYEDVQEVVARIRGQALHS